MIFKVASLLYLVDFDGTVAGSDEWHSYLVNCHLSLSKLHFNPSDLDIRWCVLTSRPKIDKLFVKFSCFYHQLQPRQIITSPTWTWKFKSLKQEGKFKEQTMKDILDGKFKLEYTDIPITRICYIDNNLEMNKLLNNARGNYRYLAISVSDFINKDYVQLLTGDE